MRSPEFQALVTQSIGNNDSLERLRDVVGMLLLDIGLRPRKFECSICQGFADNVGPQFPLVGQRYHEDCFEHGGQVCDSRAHPMTARQQLGLDL